jgi:hypothetical protein
MDLDLVVDFYAALRVEDAVELRPGWIAATSSLDKLQADIDEFLAVEIRWLYEERGEPVPSSWEGFRVWLYLIDPIQGEARRLTEEVYGGALEALPATPQVLAFNEETPGPELLEAATRKYCEIRRKPFQQPLALR